MPTNTMTTYSVRLRTRPMRSARSLPPAPPSPSRPPSLAAAGANLLGNRGRRRMRTQIEDVQTLQARVDAVCEMQQVNRCAGKRKPFSRSAVAARGGTARCTCKQLGTSRPLAHTSVLLDASARGQSRTSSLRSRDSGQISNSADRQRAQMPRPRLWRLWHHACCSIRRSLDAQRVLVTRCLRAAGRLACLHGTRDLPARAPSARCHAAARAALRAVAILTRSGNQAAK